MPSERSEHHATRQALEQVHDYIAPGTNEGISFAVSRLTDDLFADSFLGGGDISLYMPTGARGVIQSNTRTDALLLDANDGSPTLPSGTQQTPTFRIQFVKQTTRPEGNLYSFCGEDSTDDAVYSLALLLI
jgi:hypothetical protein